jgi:hypothetical protein
MPACGAAASFAFGGIGFSLCSTSTTRNGHLAFVGARYIGARLLHASRYLQNNSARHWWPKISARSVASFASTPGPCRGTACRARLPKRHAKSIRSAPPLVTQALLLALRREGPVYDVGKTRNCRYSRACAAFAFGGIGFSLCALCETPATSHSTANPTNRTRCL